MLAGVLFYTDADGGLTGGWVPATVVVRIIWKGLAGPYV